MQAKCLLFLLSLVFACSAQVQFLRDDLNFILATSTASNQTTYHMLLEGPSKYGWIAVGTGDAMQNSLMFIVYPSDSSSATLSVRTASGHDTPSSISDVPVNITSSAVSNGNMSVQFSWPADEIHQYSAVNPASSQQSFIWAVGPDQQLASSSLDAPISQHRSYGSFAVNMTATQIERPNHNLTSIPSENLTQATGGVLPSKSLVVIHAILLGGSFVILFPLATMALRFEWAHSFRAHWLTQCVGTLASFIGFAIAIAMSVQSRLFSAFDTTHQILGIVLTCCLLLQVFFGWRHHVNFKVNRSRTTVSYAHMMFGRLLIYVGMVNTVL
ncbi:hypothetical protein MBLNU457_7312t2 [Dothideomycetes sp. NU457]